jgi:hypothetical protein
MVCSIQDYSDFLNLTHRLVFWKNHKEHSVSETRCLSGDRWETSVLLGLLERVAGMGLAFHKGPNRVGASHTSPEVWNAPVSKTLFSLFSRTPDNGQNAQSCNPEETPYYHDTIQKTLTWYIKILTCRKGVRGRNEAHALSNSTQQERLQTIHIK